MQWSWSIAVRSRTRNSTAARFEKVDVLGVQSVTNDPTPKALTADQ
jgi:hypothetical protein